VHDAEQFPAPPHPPAPAAPIPGQRLPEHAELFAHRAPVELNDLPPMYLVPGTAPLPLPPVRRRRRGLAVGATMLLVVALVLGVAAVYVADRQGRAERAAAATTGPSARKTPSTPLEAANAALKDQAAALLRGDEQAWLAAVDPARSKLLTRYRSMFASLRALGIGHFAYRTFSNPADPAQGTVRVTADIEYCFSTDKCAGQKDGGVQSDDPPTLTQDLTLKQVQGRYVITEVTTKKSRARQQPTPWESDDLVFAQGSRVTLIAGRAERRHFAEVLPIAEKAARVNDRFAGLVGNPQQKYRIYLAGTKQWKSWYGGITDKWVVGYAMPLGESGSDVVLNMARVRESREVLATTLQHELGHVVTLGGAHRTGGRGDMWLEEGIAEYIGWYPKSATASWRRSAVHDALRGRDRPKSIAMRGLASDAGPTDSDAFYGLGHFASDCLARRYGQGALFTFVRLYLRENRDLDPASQEAFGQPFAAVDKVCVGWIRDRA
jgi:hypothetical protein